MPTRYKPGDLTRVIQRKSVPTGTPLKCVLRYVGGPRDDREEEATVTDDVILEARTLPQQREATWLTDTDPLPAAATIQTGTYRLVPVVVEGDTPVFAAVWEGWRG